MHNFKNVDKEDLKMTKKALALLGFDISHLNLLKTILTIDCVNELGEAFSIQTSNLISSEAESLIEQWTEEEKQ
jgi:hypothetical protein